MEMPEHAASFALVRATAHDIPEIVDLMYDAFEDFVRRVVMGCYSQDDMPKLVAQYIGEMQNDPSDIWIKVSDVNTGKIVAASNWKLCATASTPRGVDEVKPWIQDEEAIELSRTVLEPLNELRLKANAEQDSYVSQHSSCECSKLTPTSTSTFASAQKPAGAVGQVA